MSNLVSAYAGAQTKPGARLPHPRGYSNPAGTSVSKPAPGGGGASVIGGKSVYMAKDIGGGGQSKVSVYMGGPSTPAPAGSPNMVSAYAGGTSSGYCRHLARAGPQSAGGMAAQSQRSYAMGAPGGGSAMGGAPKSQGGMVSAIGAPPGSCMVRHPASYSNPRSKRPRPVRWRARHPAVRWVAQAAW